MKQDLDKILEKHRDMKKLIQESSTVEQAIKDIEIFLDLHYRDRFYSSYSFNKEYPNISDVCDFLLDDAIYPVPDNIKLLLSKILQKGLESPFSVRPITDFLAKQGNSKTLAYLLLAIKAEKKELEKATYPNSDRYVNALAEWNDRRNKLLIQFSSQSIINLETLIDLTGRLKKYSDSRYGFRTELDEHKRFLIKKRIIDFLENESIDLSDHFYFLLTFDSSIVADIIDIILKLADAKQIEELKKQTKDIPEYFAEDFVSNAEIVIARYENTFTDDLSLSGSVNSITQALSSINTVISLPGAGHRKTWLNDPYLETILYKAVQKIDDKFSEDFTKDHASHEPVLTGQFLRDFEEVFNAITPELEKLGTVITKKHFSFNVKFRDVQPQESKWDADIAFLLKCVVQDKMVKTHAVLIQCKKMHFDKKTRKFVPSWNIDITQCRGLLKNSVDSVYFLYGPDLPPVKTHVVPARAILGIVNANLFTKSLSGEKPKDQATNVIKLEQIAGISHTLADFFLYDFINCWVGDEFRGVVMVADGKEDVEEDGFSFQQDLSPRARNIVEIELIVAPREN